MCPPVLPTSKIPYLSERLLWRLALAEHRAGLSPGRIAELLTAWSGITRQSGFPLCPALPVCSCPGCDPVGARWELAELLAALPWRERALIKVPLGRIDRWYAARTLPDPHSASVYWFERRLMEQQGWGRL